METEQAPESQEISPLVEEIKMLDGLAEKNLGRDAYANKKVAFAQHLRETYPDWAQSEAYHALAGSTLLPEAGDPKGDFPGDDSIVLFLRGLIY